MTQNCVQIFKKKKRKQSFEERSNAIDVNVAVKQLRDKAITMMITHSVEMDVNSPHFIGLRIELDCRDFSDED